jgi:hypothetical protein
MPAGTTHREKMAMTSPGREHHERSILAAIGEWWRRHVGGAGSAGEPGPLGQDDVERMAHDLGLTAGELQDFAARGLHAADEAPRMIRALGMDPDEIRKKQPAVFIDIVRCCALCEEKGRCINDLETGQAPEHFGEYCLNSYTLNALRAIHTAKAP